MLVDCCSDELLNNGSNGIIALDAEGGQELVFKPLGC